MKTIGELSVGVILTFEDGEQEFFDASAHYPNVPLHAINTKDLEVDILEQILSASEETIRFNQLVKISLCYDNGNVDDNKSKLIEHLIRDRAKYYFQPNQRGPIEEALMQRVTGLAIETQAFAA